MSIRFNEEERFLIDRRETALEWYLAIHRILEKLDHLNNEAFEQLEGWAEHHGLSASNEDGVFGVYREDWCNLDGGAHGVELIVDHADDAAVFGIAPQLAAGVWCGALSHSERKRQQEKELRKQFGERLRNLISQRLPTLFELRREPESYRPFLVDVASDVRLIEVVLSEGKFSEFVIAEFERLHPLVELVDQVYKNMVTPHAR